MNFWRLNNLFSFHKQPSVIIEHDEGYDGLTRHFLSSVRQLHFDTANGFWKGNYIVPIQNTQSVLSGRFQAISMFLVSVIIENDEGYDGLTRHFLSSVRQLHFDTANGFWKGNYIVPIQNTQSVLSGRFQAISMFF